MNMNKNLLLGLIGAVAIGLTACSNTCGVDGAVTPGTPEDFAANVPDTVYFNFDKSSISEAAAKRLEAQACWLKTYSSTKATVEGHCDARGTTEYNMALGESRATAASKGLQKQGIDSSRITTVSYGKSRPIDTGTTEEAYAKNRRALTVINK